VDPLFSPSGRVRSRGTPPFSLSFSSSLLWAASVRRNRIPSSSPFFSSQEYGAGVERIHRLSLPQSIMKQLGFFPWRRHGSVFFFSPDMRGVLSLFLPVFPDLHRVFHQRKGDVGAATHGLPSSLRLLPSFLFVPGRVKTAYSSLSFSFFFPPKGQHRGRFSPLANPFPPHILNTENEMAEFSPFFPPLSRKVGDGVYVVAPMMSSPSAPAPCQKRVFFPFRRQTE